MSQKYLIIAFTLLTVFLLAAPDAKAHAPVVGYFQTHKPVRKVIKAAVVLPVRAARAAVAIPMRVVGKTAAWFRENRPVRRTVRAMVRVAARPIARIGCRRCH